MLVLTPSLVLVTLSVLKYVLGVSAPFDAVEPYVTPWVTHPVGETLVVLAPYVGFVLALLPVLRTQLSWRESRLTATLAISAPMANIAVAALSACVATFMALYWVAENL